MRLSFEIAGVSAEYHRNFWTGGAELRVGDDVVWTLSPFRVSTQVQLSTRNLWRVPVDEREVEIAMVRPRFGGGARRKSFTISVDGIVVATATGR